MADYQYVTGTGIVVPDTADLLTEVQDEYKGVFGADLIVDASTPQGALIVAETLARDAMVRNNAAVANQINPNIAGGIWLDAIMSLTGMYRLPATQSVVSGVTVTGVPGTIIPEGAQAKTAAGDVFETTGSVTISGLGSATVEFQSIESGPVPCQVGALDTIVTGVLGWETVDNTSAAVLGRASMSDIAARIYRRKTLAKQGTALAEAISGNLMALNGVRSLSFYENYTSADVTVDSRVVLKNSIRVCVDGGTDSEVAGVLLAKKSLGCNWSGNVTVNVTESVSGQVYAVKFDRPTDVPVKCQITIKVAPGVSDPIAAVKKSVLNYANGEQADEAGFVVGEDVSPFEIAGAVSREYPGSYISNVLVAKTSGTLASTPVVITRWEKASIIEGNIEVVVL